MTLASLCSMGKARGQKYSISLHLSVHRGSPEIIYQWIQIAICAQPSRLRTEPEAKFAVQLCSPGRANNMGTFGVPPPVLTRAYQDLGLSMIRFHQAMKFKSGYTSTCRSKKGSSPALRAARRRRLWKSPSLCHMWLQLGCRMHRESTH